MDTFTLILEIIGTIAFASSGAMIAIQKKMDIFGVNVLGATTAVGGGIMRDVILGVTPPSAFSKPVYILFAVITSTLLFVIVYTNPFILRSKIKYQYYDAIMMLCDTLGLGIFTVVGIQAAANVMHENNAFFFTFVGVLTGVGGGVYVILWQEKHLTFLCVIFMHVRRLRAELSVWSAVLRSEKQQEPFSD